LYSRVGRNIIKPRVAGWLGHQHFHYALREHPSLRGRTGKRDRKEGRDASTARAPFSEILLKVRRERSDSSIYRADPEGHQKGFSPCYIRDPVRVNITELRRKSDLCPSPFACFVSRYTRGSRFDLYILERAIWNERRYRQRFSSTAEFVIEIVTRTFNDVLE